MYILERKTNTILYIQAFFIELARWLVVYPVTYYFSTLKMFAQEAFSLMRNVSLKLRLREKYHSLENLYGLNLLIASINFAARVFIYLLFGLVVDTIFIIFGFFPILVIFLLFNINA